MPNPAPRYIDPRDAGRACFVYPPKFSLGPLARDDRDGPPDRDAAAADATAAARRKKMRMDAVLLLRLLESHDELPAPPARVRELIQVMPKRSNTHAHAVTRDAVAAALGWGSAASRSRGGGCRRAVRFARVAPPSLHSRFFALERGPSTYPSHCRRRRGDDNDNDDDGAPSLLLLLSRPRARARPAAPKLTSWGDERRGVGRSEVVGVQQPEWDETIASLLTDEPPILRDDGGELFF